MNHSRINPNELEKLPNFAGCYLFRNEQEEVIYVGKAIDLKKRVKSYFNQKNQALGYKTALLVSKISTIEFILSENEAAALLLENNLIKKYNPKFNTRLKSDKSYPYLYYSPKEEFARFSILRRPYLQINVKEEYGKNLFGPFPDGQQLYHLLQTLNQTLGLRDCSLKEFKSRKFPCLLYQMEKCTAPCVGLIAKEEYDKKIGILREFLQGKSKKLIQHIKEKMIKYSDEENFELAIKYRNTLELLNKLKESEKLEYFNLKSEKDSWDIWCVYSHDLYTSICLKEIRQGQFLGAKNWIIESALYSDMDSLLNTYYSSQPSVHLVNIYCENFSKSVPMENQLENFYQLGILQAQLYLQNTIPQLLQQQHALSELSLMVGLNRPIYSLECFDVAVLQGQSPTGSCVRFENNSLAKDKYRHYKLRSVKNKNNDFVMLLELMERRLENKDIPDILIIDGGRPQIEFLIKHSFTLRNLIEANIIKIIGVAKERKTLTNNYEERIIFLNPENAPYILNQNLQLSKIICTLRDEAHRFCRRLHHLYEKKRLIP